MKREYVIDLGDQAVGTAWVTRQGLYYHIRVQCDLTGEMMRKVLVSCDGKEENLGILVPENGRFACNTRIPVKRLGEGELRFRVLPKHGDLGENWVPLAPEEPFRYISRLKEAYLIKQKGQPAVAFRSS